MKDIIIGGLILIAALINFVPIIGVVSSAKLETLYGLTITSPDLEILMRHRALLFGMLGGFMAYAALSGQLQNWAIGAGLLSMVSFIALAYSVGDFSFHISKINKADIAGILCLAVAAVLKFLK